MIRCVSNAGSNFKPPNRHSFGMDRNKSGGFGYVLQDAMDKDSLIRQDLLNGVQFTGGTLCNDGAKWRKRSVLNSTLITLSGPFYVNSNEVTGSIKNAKFLKDDIDLAIKSIGPENVFVIVLDGACKATLNLIENDVTMHKVRITLNQLILRFLTLPLVFH